MIGHLPTKLSRWFLTAAAMIVPTQLLAQSLGQGSADADLSSWRIFATLVFLLALVSIAWILMKVRGRPLTLFQPLAARQVTVSEVTRISTQVFICLIKFDGYEYLLAVTPQTIAVIEKRPIHAAAKENMG